MRYLVSKEIKSETKVGKSIYLFDFFFLITYMAISVSYTHLDVYKRQDNAAMIGVAAYYEYIKGTRHGWDLNAVPNLKLGER